MSSNYELDELRDEMRVRSERAEMRHEDELASLRRQVATLREACWEMHRTLTSPSRILLDSTRRELEPWIPMLTAALAATEETPE